MKRLFCSAIATTLVLASCSQPDARQSQLSALAKELSQQFELGPTPLRYNPVDCDCPPFEVKSSKGWIRVRFSDSQQVPDELLPLLEVAKEDLAQGGLSIYPRTLDLDSSTPRFCANGTPYFSVELLVD